MLHFLSIFARFRQKFIEIWTKFHRKIAKSNWTNAKILKIQYSISQKVGRFFCRNFAIWAVQRNANLVDLGESFPTSIWLQKSASIQPRTSLSKFGGWFNSIFNRLLSPHRSVFLFFQKERLWLRSHLVHRLWPGFRGDPLAHARALENASRRRAG